MFRGTHASPTQTRAGRQCDSTLRLSVGEPEDERYGAPERPASRLASPRVTSGYESAVWRHNVTRSDIRESPAGNGRSVPCGRSTPRGRRRYRIFERNAFVRSWV